MDDKQEIILQLMKFKEYEIPQFFVKFDSAITPAIEVMNDKQQYIYHQINLLDNYELELLKEDIKREQKANKQHKIFISHSSEDKEYIQLVVALFEQIGITKECLFCSSDPVYGVPLQKNIFDYLKEQFNSFKLHVIFMLSENYYNSPAALNEMGAAWVLQNKKTTILLPGFNYNDIKGVVRNDSIYIKLDEEERTLKARLNEFYRELLSEFEMNKLDWSKWEQHRDDFIIKIQGVR